MHDLNGNGRMDVGDHMLYDSYFGGNSGGHRPPKGGGSGCGTMILMVMGAVAAVLWMIL